MPDKVIKINEDIHRNLKVNSALEGRSMKEIIEKLISEYLEKHETRKEVNGKDKTVKGK